MDFRIFKTGRRYFFYWNVAFNTRSLEFGLSCQFFLPETRRSLVSVWGSRGIVIQFPSVLYHERFGWYGHLRPLPLLPSAAEEVATVFLLLLNELLVADADHHHHHDDGGDPEHQDDSRQVVQLALCEAGKLELLRVREKAKTLFLCVCVNLFSVFI